MSAAENVVLGKIPCLVCSTPVLLRANKNDLAYFGCAECGLQVMTRGRGADRKMRAMIVAAPAAPTPPKETPSEKPKPVAKPAAGGQPAAAGKPGIW